MRWAAGQVLLAMLTCVMPTRAQPVIYVHGQCAVCDLSRAIVTIAMPTSDWSVLSDGLGEPVMNCSVSCPWYLLVEATSAAETATYVVADGTGRRIAMTEAAGCTFAVNISNNNDDETSMSYVFLPGGGATRTNGTIGAPMAVRSASDALVWLWPTTGQSQTFELSWEEICPSATMPNRWTFDTDADTVAMGVAWSIFWVALMVLLFYDSAGKFPRLFALLIALELSGVVAMAQRMPLHDWATWHIGTNVAVAGGWFGLQSIRLACPRCCDFALPTPQRGVRLDVAGFTALLTSLMFFALDASPAFVKKCA